MSKETQTPEFTEAELTAMLEETRKRKRAEKTKRHNAYIADKDNFLKHTGSKFQSLQNELAQLKQYTIAKANELWEEMHDMNGKEVKEDQKTFTFKNEADTLKITVARQERFEFTEEAIVHINSIRDRFKEKFAPRNKGMYDILDGLLLKNSKQEYDPKLLAKARQQVRKLEDAQLIEDFDKLDECQRVTGSSLYCRVYTRKEPNGNYEDVSLQFSSL